MDQVKYWRGNPCEGRGWRDVGEHKGGGKNTEDEESCGGMYPGF